jgi:hypothetical protein
MSNYIRVLPRDLFNEASLLKCYGRLWILLDETHGHTARFETEDSEVFDIVQDEASGAIYVRNISFTVDGTEMSLTRPLNARSEWPLYVESDDACVAVFDDAGNLSQEMRAFIGLTAPVEA